MLVESCNDHAPTRNGGCWCTSDVANNEWDDWTLDDRFFLMGGGRWATRGVTVITSSTILIIAGGKRSYDKESIPFA